MTVKVCAQCARRAPLYALYARGHDLARRERRRPDRDPVVRPDDDGERDAHRARRLLQLPPDRARRLLRRRRRRPTRVPRDEHRGRPRELGGSRSDTAARCDGRDRDLAADVLVFVGALLDAPGATARAALFPDVVELAGLRMERAAGIRAGIQQGAQLVGAPSVASSWPALGATAALWIDAASFLVSAGLVLLLVPRPHRDASSEARGRFLAELADGLRFIWRKPLVRAVVAMVLLLEPHRGAAVGRARRLRPGGVRQRGGLRHPRRRPRRRRAGRRSRIQRDRAPAAAAADVPRVLLGRADRLPRPRRPALTPRRARGVGAVRVRRRPDQSTPFHRPDRDRPGRAPWTRLRRDSRRRLGLDPTRDPARRGRGRGDRRARDVPRDGRLARGRRRLRLLQPDVPRDGLHSAQLGARAESRLRPRRPAGSSIPRISSTVGAMSRRCASARPVASMPGPATT